MAAGDLALAITISAVDNATNIVNQIAASIGQLAGGGAMGAVATGAAEAGIALVGMGASAVKSAGDYQQGITTLVTSAGEAQSNLKMVSDGILQISTDTGTSTDQLVKGMYLVESSGQHGAAGLSVLKTAAQGAKAENADLGVVTNALTTVLTDYHLKSTDATSAMNGLITAVSDGKTHLQDMSSAMGAVLPLASSLGVQFPNVAAAIATMTNSGMSAQQSAQNLANAMRALAAPNAVAAKSMTAVGLSAQQLKDTLTTQGLDGAIKLIEEHVGKTFPAGSVQAVQAFKNIMGGATGYKVALMLGGENMKAYEANIKNITEAMNKGGDSVMGWDLIQGNFNFQIDRAKAALDAFMIVIGQKLLPIVTPIVAGFTSIVEQITNLISGFGGAGQAGDGFSGILDALGINSKTFNGILGLLGVTFGYLKDIVQEVGNILSTIFGAALQVIGQAIGSFVNNDLSGMIAGFNGVLYTVRNVLDAVSSGLGDFLSQVQQVFGIISPIFDDLATNAQTWGSNFINGFGSGVMSALDGIVNVVMQVITEIESYLGFASPTRKGPGKNVYKWGTGLAQGMATGMTQGIPLLTDAAGNMMTATVTASTINAPQGISHSSPSSASSASSAANAVKPATAGLATALHSGAGAVSAAAKHVGSQLNQICHTNAQSTSACASHHLTTGLATKLKSGAGTVKAAAHTVGAATHPIADHAAKTAAATAKHLAKIPTHAKKAAKDVAAAVAGALPQGMQLGESPVKAAADSIGKAIDSIGTHAKNAVDGIKALGPAAEGVKQAWAQVVTIFNQVKVAIQQAIEYMTPGILSIWRVIQTQLLPALANLWNTVKPLVVDVGKLTVAVGMAVVAFTRWLTSASTLKAIWDGLVVATKIVIVILTTLINALSKALKPAIDQIGTTVKTQLAPAWKTFQDAIQPCMPVLIALAKFIAGVLLLALTALIGVLGGLLRAFGALLAGVIKFVGGFIEMLSGLATTAMGTLQFIYDLFTGNFGKLKKDLEVIWSGIQMTFKGTMDQMSAVCDGFVNAVNGLISGFVDTVINFFQNLYDALVGHSIIPDMINAILAWFTKLVDAVPTMINNIVKYFTDGWNTIKTGATAAWKAINQLITDATVAFLAIVTTMWQKIQTLFNAAWNTYIVTPLNTIKTNFATWFNALATNFAAWGANLIKMFTQSILNGIPAVTQAATAVANVIKSLLGIASPAQTGPLSTADKWIPNLMTMFSNQIKAGTPAVTAATTQLATQVQQKITDMSDKVKQAITSMTNSLDDVKTNLQAVTSQVQQGIATLNTDVSTAGSQVQQTLSNMMAQVQTASANTMRTVTTLGSTIATTMNGVVANVNTQANQANTVSSGTVTYAKSTQQVTMSTNATSATDTKNTMSTTESLISQMRSLTGDFTGYMHDFQTESSRQLNDTATREQTQGYNLISYAYSVAAAVQSILGHTTPTKGPMKDDNLWTAHFIDNLVQPMIAGVPRVAAAANLLATSMAGAAPPSVSRSTAAPTVGSQSPIVVQVTMDGAVNLDGKAVGKYVTGYLQKEIHVVGNIRNR